MNFRTTGGIVQTFNPVGGGVNKYSVRRGYYDTKQTLFNKGSTFDAGGVSIGLHKSHKHYACEI